MSVESTVRHPEHALTTILAILFLTFLDNTIVAVTLADVQGSLHMGIVGLQWVVNGYMLAFAALMLTGGTLGDLWGRKKVMLSGVALFVLGSAVCLIAPSGAVLIVGRVIMGVGAAASEPGTLSMIRHIYPDRKKRARAIGAWAAVCSVALALGPILGGVIIGLIGWRAVFALSLILGAGAFVAGAIFLPENSDPQGRKLDVPGLLLGGLSLACVSFGIIQGESAGYTNGWIIALFCLSLAFGIAFVLVERRSSDPVLRLEFFTLPAFAGANFTAFAANFGVFAIFFFAALYLQIMAGFSGYGIAVGFITMAVCMVASSLWSGRWVARHGPRLPSVLGCFLSGAGLLLVRATLHPDITIATLAWAVSVVGLGLGMTLVAVNALVLSLVPAERSGMASSTVNTFRELGGVFGVSVLGAIMNACLTSTLSTRLAQAGVPESFRRLIIMAVTHGGGRVGKGGAISGAPPGFEGLVKTAIHAAEDAFGSGLRIVFIIAAVVLFVAGVFAWWSVRRPSAINHDNAYVDERKIS